jgi:S-adenosylmethionine hydrolase
VIHLREERFFLSPRSTTFHGRDVFAPVAAALAAGTPPTALGPEVPDMVRLTLPAVRREGDALRGEVIYVDAFGNLCTNLDAEALDAFPARALSISLGEVRLGSLAASYSTVASGEPLAVVNSWGFVEIAVRDGSARERLQAGVGTPVVVRP